ncbi:MAG: DinB family protein [Candidatus Odinarchaeota archaeon]
MDKTETNRIILNSIREQYGATFKMLENVINKCPDSFWNDSKNGPPFYKIVYHTMFFIDLYLSRTKEERTSFTPRFSKQEDYRISPENFSNPQEPTLSKSDVLDYLHDLKIKGKKRIESLTLQELINESVFEWHGSSILSSMLYNLRHVMLHIGALQVRLRMQGIEFENWVSQSPIVE